MDGQRHHKLSRTVTTTNEKQWCQASYQSPSAYQLSARREKEGVRGPAGGQLRPTINLLEQISQSAASKRTQIQPYGSQSLDKIDFQHSVNWTHP